jgi:flotillin
MNFAVASANEYLIITGLGISEIKVCKKAIVLPGQRLGRLSLSPLNYSLSLHAMTIEKLEFTLPAVFTIGPKDDPESILKYARLLSDSTRGTDHIKELVTGIVEGETRVIAAGMTMEEIFKERAFFKEHVMQGIQSEVIQFGMTIYNANVKQLQDAPGSEYFKYLRLKSQEGAINQAKVDVASAKTLGAVGEKKRDAEKRMQIIEVESNTVIYEQNRQVDIAKAASTLETEKTRFSNNVAIAKIEANKKALIVEAELQAQVEVKNALVQQEKERADKLSKTVVQAEMIKTMADADLYVSQKTAEAFKLKAEAQADGTCQPLILRN